MPFMRNLASTCSALAVRPVRRWISQRRGDLEEAAANLFAMLHRLDEEAERIAVSPVPEAGLGRAINDRLRRAAAPRPGEVP